MMTRLTILERNLADALNKPPQGQPCNGCGFCCAVELCDMAEQVFSGAVAPCPALEYRDGRAWCGLVTRPSHHLKLNYAGADEHVRPLIQRLLGIGRGCDTSD